jgi:antitoxin component of MazEF toxin-antitoxin module
MLKSLTRHGNSLALVIEKPILELLGVSAETVFEITTDGHVLVLTPVKNSKQTKKVLAAAEEIKKQYHEVLKKLAD